MLAEPKSPGPNPTYTQAMSKLGEAILPPSVAVPTPSVVSGAKRRKPLKTNRVTQHHSHDPQEEDESKMLLDVECPVPKVDLALTPEAEIVPNQALVPDEDLPPIPKPIISATTVITTSGDHTYKCPRCLQVLGTQKEFTAHIRAHNEVKPHPDPNDPTGQAKVYYCSLCSKMLSSFSSLDRHMLVHSGERPFSCELCGQTFTTNGNMHRHKRTHSAKELQEYGEAMGGLIMSSGRRGGGRKRKSQVNDTSAEERPMPNKKNLKETASTASQSQDPFPNIPVSIPMSMNHLNTLTHPNHPSTCPICQESFNSDLQLESHILNHHKANQMNKCDECDFTSHNLSMLQVHKFFHRNPISLPPSTISSLTPLCLASAQPQMRAPPPSSLASSFLPPTSLQCPPSDFLSHQFPQLAKAFLTEDQHRHGKPLSAFSEKQPIVTSNNHCDTILSSTQSALYQTQLPEAFSSGLASLQPGTTTDDEDRASPKPPNGSKSSHDNPDYSHSEDISQDDNDTSSESGELIGAHDDHDPIIKDMKLKGEFPCRLCPAVYPNLRALKGHNKEHLNKAPYLCNVGACTYSSSDKSTLTRHMRTHTGEKPFECKLCNYGFTTKANCERHLKNKHGKTNREEIRECLILHETEEPEHPIAKMQIDDHGKFRCKVCKQHFFTSDKVIAHAMKEHPAYADKADHIFEELRTNRSSSEIKEKIGDLGGPSMVPRLSQFPSLSQLRPLLPSQLNKERNGEKAAREEGGDEDENETPLDLSRPGKPELLEDGPRPLRGGIQATAAGNMIAAPIVLPPIDALMREELLKANPTAALTMGLFSPLMIPGVPLCRGPVPTSSSNMLPTTASLPFSFAQFMPSMASAFNLFSPAGIETLQAEMKQRLQMQGQNPQQQHHQSILAAAAAAANAGLSGGGAGGGTPLVAQPPPLVPNDVAAYLASAQSEVLRKQQEKKGDERRGKTTTANGTDEGRDEDKLVGVASTPPKAPRSLNSSRGEARSDAETNDVEQSSDSESNYKMVIKNGVLMKKQKQRRYRTERPYGCDHCSARFTLRSNMERHIKQQHPDHWSSKPRGCRRSSQLSAPSSITNLPDKGEENEESPELKDNASDTTDNKDIIEIDSDHGDHRDPVEKEDVLSLVIDDDEDKSQSGKPEEDLASVPNLLNNAANHQLHTILDSNGVDGDDEEECLGDEDDDMHDDEDSCNWDDSSSTTSERRKSAYSAAPHKIQCPKCPRKFPWTSSLNRHLLTHSGDKPYKCRSCPLLFTTKSNCDRHQLRKHGNGNNNNDQAFTMRNVAERPFKCDLCPSSSFSTEENLESHRSSKHCESREENGSIPGTSENDSMESDKGSTNFPPDPEEPEANGATTTVEAKAEITNSLCVAQSNGTVPPPLKGKKKKSLMDTIAKLSSSAVEKRGEENK